MDKNYKYDVFISYSRKDTAVADKIVKAFEKAGITCFIDKLGIGGGLEFPAVLSKAIRDSRVFLFLASKNSYESKFTQSEIVYAFNKKKKQDIIPYIIDESNLPDELEFTFSAINWRRMSEHPIDTVLVNDVLRAKRERGSDTNQELADNQQAYQPGQQPQQAYQQPTQPQQPQQTHQQPPQPPQPQQAYKQQAHQQPPQPPQPQQAYKQQAYQQPPQPSPQPQQSYQQPYQVQQQSYQQPKAPMRPENHMLWGILCTVFCCLPLGIIAIVFSNKVNTLYDSGDYSGAQEAADNAKKWAMWGAIIGIVFLVLYFIALAVFGNSMEG